MTTTAKTPWGDGSGNAVARSFSEADLQLKHLVSDKRFNLSQFAHMSPDIDEARFLDELSWRHYIVFSSTIFAIKNTRMADKNLAECGVCDGLTIFYALSAARSQKTTCRAYLYDAWDAMRGDLLTDTEKQHEGAYGYLDMENTRKNLNMFETEQLVFNKGYIPDSFESAQNPDRLVWLHIDLNSSTPTLHTLDFFWDRLEDGGVILFDDYAVPGYEDTKSTVDDWTEAVNGTLLHLPTGQALLVKDQFATAS